MNPDLDTALAFVRAIVERDPDAACALADDGIQLFGLKGPGKGPGPGGLARGHEGLRKWLAATRYSPGTPTQAFVLGDRVLVVHGSTASSLRIVGGKVRDYLPEEGPDPVRRHGFRGAQEIDLAKREAVA